MERIFGKHNDEPCTLRLRAGEVVEVKSKDEIVATLDENCELEGLPFMAEMSKYCRKRLRVLTSVNRIIVEGIGIRFIKNVAILEGATCDGEAHAGCERACFVLWKEAWLRRAPKKISLDNQIARASTVCLLAFCKNPKCQSASLPKASTDLPIWDYRRFLSIVSQRGFRAMLLSLRLEILQFLTGNKPLGMSSNSRKTPTAALKLQPGEIVEVRNKDEIVTTLDYAGRNRGLEFTKEMEKYCGKRMKVLKIVDRMIVEKTGKMRQIANTVFLDGATCDGQSHGGCPRNCYCFFREIWLRRVDTEPGSQQILK